MILSSKRSAHRRSHDMYVRMRAGDLHHMQLTHLHSSLIEANPDIGLQGATEWSGHHRGLTTSIGWDWAVDPGDPLRVPTPGVLTCNIMLIGADGRDLGPTATTAACLQLVALLSWQRPAMEIWRNSLH